MAGPGAAGLTGGLGDLGKLTELRHRIFFVLGAILVFRIGSFIPLPGIDPHVLEVLVEQQKGTILDRFNMFSGGALARLSLLALGIMPYISASIIMQLLSYTVPALEQIKKEGEAGRHKITQYTRYGTVVLATFQAIGISTALQGQVVGGIGKGHGCIRPFFDQGLLQHKFRFGNQGVSASNSACSNISRHVSLLLG